MFSTIQALGGTAGVNFLLLLGVGLLAFANGANDNFKGVATLWGASRTSYWRALAWATLFTLFGAVGAAWLAKGLIPKFNGSALVSGAVAAESAFLAAIVLGAAVTVLLASRLGLPISTTHALTGALAGTGVLAAGFFGIHWTALMRGVVLPLLLSPVLALILTLLAASVADRLVLGRDCLCVDPARIVAIAGASSAAAVAIEPPRVRRGTVSECAATDTLVRWQVSDALHWLSAAAISFARGLNDTPKIAAVLLVAPFSLTPLSWFALPQAIFLLVGLLMAAGGVAGALRVAQTMSKKITSMPVPDATGANLTAALLVGMASGFSLPVSTTHVTSGGIFGIGLRRRQETNWSLVREILLAWLGTLPIAAAFGAMCYFLLHR